MSGVVYRLGYAPFAVVLYLCCVGLPAANGRDQRDGQADKPRLLMLQRLDAYLEFKSDYRYDRVDSTVRTGQDSSRSQTNREFGFEQRLGLKLAGTLIDPGFITFQGDLSFALTQDRFDEFGTDFDTRRDRDTGYLLQYDLRVNFFQGKKLAGSVYGLRQDDRISRRFQPTLDERRTGLGTNWIWADETFPMELSFDYLHTDRTGNADSRDNEEYVQSTLHYGAKWIIHQHHRFKFSYEHSETDQEFQGRRDQFDTTRDLLKIDHELGFGPEYKHSLRTVMRWQEESGDFARDLFEIGPQVRLQHSDTLQTSYKYQFNRERYAGLDIETQHLDFQLTHQMYTNLTTTLDVFGLYEDIEDDINTAQYGASVDWQYNRRNPYGHFYANLALAYDTQRVTGDGGDRLVLDEAQTFRDPVALRLYNRNVIPATIVVTDTGNRRIYRLGLDFTVFAQGDVTRIARIRTGLIADNDTILVDYQYRTPTNGDIDTMRVDFSLEQRFDGGLTPYYRFSYRNQEDEPSAGFTRRADRTDHHRIGTRYETSRYTLGAEYEIFDDTIDPYDAFHLNGLVHLISSGDHSLDASTRVSRLFFEGGFDDRHVTMIDAELDHRWRLSNRVATVERLAYRFEDDSVAGETHAWDVALGLEYVVGDLSAEVTVEYDRLQLPDSEQEDFGLYVRLRRDITDLFGRR